MKYGSLLIGIAASGALLLLLAVTRLFAVRVEAASLDIRQIELATLPKPPPPPPPPEEPPPENPPPPAVTTVEELPDPTRVPLPKAGIPLRLDAPVTTFFTNLDPAPLPEPVVASRPSPRKPVSRTPRRSPPAPPPPPRQKSHYRASELDGKPQLLRHGSTIFPSALARQGVTRGRVVLEVELDERGKVRVRRVISSSHPELIPGAKRVAAGARFTAPTRHGRPVKAVMRWPIVIRK